MGRLLDLVRGEKPNCTHDQNATNDQSPPLVVSVVPAPSPYDTPFAVLEGRCPAHVPASRYRHTVEDARGFLAQWAHQAGALGWSVEDLFSLHDLPADPHPTYSRLSRLDQAGLVWVLRGGDVVALTATEAVIRTASGATLRYRRTV